MTPTIGRRIHYTALVTAERLEVDPVALGQTREAQAEKYAQDEALAADEAKAIEDEGEGLSDEERAAKCQEAKAFLENAKRTIEEQAAADEKAEALELCMALAPKPVVKAALIVGCTPRHEGAGDDEADWKVDLEIMPEHVVFNDVPFSATPLEPLHWNWPPG